MRAACRACIFSIAVCIAGTSIVAACGDDSTTQPARDAGSNLGAEAGASDAPYRRVEDGPRTPICEGLDPTSTTPRLELQIDGVTKTAGETKISTDNNGRIQITVGYPTITMGSTGSQVFYVRFLPDAGSGPCDGTAFGHPRSAGYSYSVPNGPVTGAHSDVGAGPCAMTLSIDGGTMRGAANGTLSNVTEKYAQTFEFKTCFVQPAP